MKVVGGIDKVEDEEDDAGEDQQEIEQVGDTFNEFQVPRNFDLFSENVGPMILQLRKVSLFS